MEFTITIKVENDQVEVLKIEKVEPKGNSKIKKCSDYARFFDASSPYWTTDSEVNLAFLRHKQLHANNVLKAKGHVFLNEVYEMLGLPKTKAGQVVGWIYDEENPTGDNYIDFGIYEEGNMDFVNGFEKNPLLDFNVDGNILDKVWEET